MTNCVYHVWIVFLEYFQENGLNIQKSVFKCVYCGDVR